MAIINLNITVDNPSTVSLVYDQIRIQRNDIYDTGTGGWDTNWVDLVDLSGVDATLDPSYGYVIELNAIQGNYSVIDPNGLDTYWYRSYYYNTTTSGQSGYSEAVLGDSPDLFYNPLYPSELDLSASEELVLNEIRRLIGDPLGLRREYGDDAASSIHPDGRTYELDEKGWPVSIHMGGVGYNEGTDPTVNGYRYLRFSECINTTEVVCSGTCDFTRGVDIWYYTFRWSDRQIMQAYDNCPVPPGLTEANANNHAYILYTAIRLLQSENWHDAIEDGALIRDEGTSYDPTPGFRFREGLLDDLNKRLDDLIKTLMLRGIEGVRVE
jgi:hypothetical protein